MIKDEPLISMRVKRRGLREATSICCAVGALAVMISCGGGGGGGSSSSSGTSTTNTTGGTVVPGANMVVYGLPSASGSTYNIDEITPTGSSNTTLLSGVSSSIIMFALNPSTGKYVIAADPTGAGTSFGIYSSPGVTLTGATALVTPSYASVTSLTVTANGTSIVYTATPTSFSGSFLYSIPLTGGTPVTFGLSDGSTVSPLDSDTIAYVAPVGTSGVDQVFTRSLKAGANGTPVEITSDATSHLLPAFSRDGTLLAYWEQTATTNTLFVDTLSSASVVSLPNPNNLIPQAIAFNSTGAQLVIAAEDANSNGELLTQTVTGGAAPNLIATQSVLLGTYGVYWTNSSGRVVGGSMGLSSVSRRRPYEPVNLQLVGP